ncbi:related to flavin-containing monooxygenase [Phialocephala subalpina]|uniref:Related to flavin-containing monooxygenase n=1 Tax=Phialocephala subalpina TaxID=576137 RepID=A0A1L7WV07_9HELO|nr:related to flavin-containing monooxygenase [Phialocephala subalpina]
MKVAIIGGGPSGLTTLKHLLTAHEFFPGAEAFEARLFEAESFIGGTFKHRDYEDAELVSSRQLTTFSDYRYTPDSPDFLSTKEYCTYLEGYAKKYNLWPSIHLQTTVTRIQRGSNGGHIIQYIEAGKAFEWHCDAVAICSGLHVIPNIPVIDGLQSVPHVIHSSRFKERNQFGDGKDILIVGSGETGMDIAHLAVTSNTNSVTLCHRDGFLCAPKRAPEPSWFGMKPTAAPQGNVPYDVGAASLFDTAYVHPLLRDSFLPWWYYDRFAKWTTWLVSGTKAGLDQWVGEISPERFHASKIFFNKSTKAMPYITSQYRTSSALNTLRSYIAQVPLVSTQGRAIDLAPWPQSISEKGIVTFVENGRPEAEVMRSKTCKPDILILATGYTQSFPFLGEEYLLPKDADMRSIWKSGDESVAFIGFVRPSFGAIPPLSEMQAQLWILNLLNRLPSPLTPTSHYRLHHLISSRITYGVDHESYAYQLALDMGSAPSFTEILPMGWKMVLCWALSAQVNTKFRLAGPWKWEGAKQVMETEIWDTVARRRGFFGHVTLSLVPMMMFGTLSAVLWALDEICKILKWVWKVMMLG